jgi:hypothetical protein
VVTRHTGLPNPESTVMTASQIRVAEALDRDSSRVAPRYTVGA